MVKMVVLRIVSILFISTISHSLVNNDYKIITKLPRSPLLKYHSYASVMILHYYIPFDTTDAKFEFSARDEKHTNIFTSKCTPRNISVYMKSGSYPVINPDGVPLPKTFINITRPEIYELTLQTDEISKYINISSPKPGDWFAVSFVSWTDERKDKIEQQGLSSACNAYLYSELAVIKNNNIVTLSPNKRTNFDVKQNKRQILKFYVNENIDHVLIEVDIKTPCKDCDYILIYVKTGSVPNENKYEDKFVIKESTESKKYFHFWPEEENWHYLNISLVNTNKTTIKKYSEIAITLKYISGLQEEFYTPSNISDKRINLFKTSIDKKIMLRNKSLQYSLPYKQYNLMRITGLDNFIFDYDFRPGPTKNESTPLYLNITSSEMTVLKFEVHEIVDIGGTLTLGLAIKPNINDKDEDDDIKYKLVGCIRANSREIPTNPDLCVHNNNATKAPFVLNSTSKGVIELFHLPYPEPGVYYFSIRAFYENCVPCNCSKQCEQFIKDCILACEINCTTNCSSCTEQCEFDVLEQDNCEYCNCDGDCWKGNNTLTNTSILFTVSSNSCFDGACGNRWNYCNNYIAGGFIFSSCHCTGGYRGWDCSDGSYAPTGSQILITLLLLTLSNLLFLPSIYFAYRRGYYTEAVTYFCSMFASTFYHACDSKENQYGFCLFRLEVLQFCDFYCGMLTIWMTLVAMAYPPPKFISIAHVAGAIILAFSVTYNKHALWVFLLPAAFGILLIGVNWGMQCRKSKKLFPAKNYLMIYFPVGLIMVLIGLISFAFLQTKENYKFTHSLWHILMALSIIFLLPNKTFVPKI